MELGHGVKEVSDEARTTPYGLCCEVRCRNTSCVHVLASKQESYREQAN